MISIINLFVWNLDSHFSNLRYNTPYVFVRLSEMIFIIIKTNRISKPVWWKLLCDFIYNYVLYIFDLPTEQQS